MHSPKFSKNKMHLILYAPYHTDFLESKIKMHFFQSYFLEIELFRSVCTDTERLKHLCHYSNFPLPFRKGVEEAKKLELKWTCLISSLYPFVSGTNLHQFQLNVLQMHPNSFMQELGKPETIIWDQSQTGLSSTRFHFSFASLNHSKTFSNLLIEQKYFFIPSKPDTYAKFLILFLSLSQPNFSAVLNIYSASYIMMYLNFLVCCR